jgi:hypothetical protein
VAVVTAAIAVMDRQSATDLHGIAWLLDQGHITGEQASQMAARVHARNSREISPRQPSHPPGWRGGQPVLPPVPLERLRQLSPEQRWQALVFLSGLVPQAVDRALAAVLTPLSTAGLAR